MDPALLDGLFKALIGLGPGGIVAAWAVYLWRDERGERRELQQKNTKLLEDTIVSRHELASALDKIAMKIGA